MDFQDKYKDLFNRQIDNKSQKLMEQPLKIIKANLMTKSLEQKSSKTSLKDKSRPIDK